MLINRGICYDSDEIEIRLPFFSSFSIFWDILGGLCTQVFYSSEWSKRWVEVIYVVKSKAMQPQPKYKTRNFQNSVRKRTIRGIH